VTCSTCSTSIAIEINAKRDFPGLDRWMRVPVDLIHTVVMRGLDPRIHRLCKIYAKKDGPAGQARG
jgi:hypothetical protein